MNDAFNIRSLGRKEIEAFLPHREPFLFVDAIDEIQVGRDSEGKPSPIGTIVKGRRKFRPEEDFFRGHFPGYPITPGVIVTESAGQIGCFIFYPFMKNPVLRGRDGEPLKLVGVGNGRFRKPVFPGDEIEATAKAVRGKRSLWFFDVTVRVAGELSAELELIANFDLNIDQDFSM